MLLGYGRDCLIAGLAVFAFRICAKSTCQSLSERPGSGVVALDQATSPVFWSTTTGPENVLTPWSTATWASSEPGAVPGGLTSVGTVSQVKPLSSERLIISASSTKSW